MEYELIYDAADRNYEWLKFIIPGLVLAVGTGTLTFSRKARTAFIRNMPERVGHVFSAIMFGLSLLWVWGAGQSVFMSENDIAGSSKDKSCAVVSGKVENFTPMPKSGHAQETFTVSGVKFGFSDFQITGGFNNTSSHGGPIYLGRNVRICYVDPYQTGNNIIARLEVEAKAAKN